MDKYINEFLRIGNSTWNHQTRLTVQSSVSSHTTDVDINTNRNESSVVPCVLLLNITTSLAMDFTRVLINEVESRPMLWDSRRKDYHSRTIVDQEWEALSQTIGQSSKFNKLFLWYSVTLLLLYLCVHV